MSTMLEEPETQTSHGGGGDDEPEFAHYALKTEITDGYVFGQPITALCGEVFVPTRDPERYPVCPKCSELMESIFGPEETG